MDSAVVGRGIRRPVEPSGDGEVQSGDLYWRRGNPVPGNEMPCPSNFPGGIRGTDDDAMLSIAAHVFHLSVGSQSFHIVGQDKGLWRRHELDLQKRPVSHAIARVVIRAV